MGFQRALLGSTLPPEALDAVSANLAILKSPTVLRQANGNVWGWEGCFATQRLLSRAVAPTSGITRSRCRTCSRPWNARCARQELVRSMNAAGHVDFRAALPDGPTTRHSFHAAADGQLGGIMKLYRDWQICGDDRVAARVLSPGAAQLGILHQAPGTRSTRARPLGAAPQHLRHRVLGAGRDVHEHPFTSARCPR